MLQLIFEVAQLTGQMAADLAAQGIHVNLHSLFVYLMHLAITYQFSLGGVLDSVAIRGVVPKLLGA